MPWAVMMCYECYWPDGIGKWSTLMLPSILHFNEALYTKVIVLLSYDREGKLLTYCIARGRHMWAA